MEALIVTLQFAALWAFLLGSLYLVDKARERDSLPKIARGTITLVVVAVTLFAALQVVRFSAKRECVADPQNEWAGADIWSIKGCDNEGVY